MKKARKIIVFLLVLAVLTCFVACSTNNQADGEISSAETNSTASAFISNNEHSATEKQSSTKSTQFKSESVNDLSCQSSSPSSSTLDSQSSADSYLPQAQAESYVRALNTQSNYPCIVNTIYKTCDTLVCDVVATDFGADKTGATDSTNAIQSAINSVSQSGGGVVFLPAGKYLVKGKINIPMYVTLRGDWQNPNAQQLSYGTVILAEPNELGSANPQDKPLIELSGNSGVVGITFYYPKQSVSQVKKYGYTIYANEPTTMTVKNVTFINSCYGIGVSLNTSLNELVNVENVYGTFIYNALEHNGTSDVGTYDKMFISPKYWAGTNLGAKPAYSAVLALTKQNCTALILGDLDDQLISNIEISGCARGIYFTRGIRADAGFWGTLYNIQITDSTRGVEADYLNSRSGALFVSSSVESIVNNSNVGIIKLCDTQATISGTGTTIVEGGEVDLSGYTFNYDESYIKTQKLYVASLQKGGRDDVTDKLNQVLQLAGSAGGGIVVIPNGIYKILGTIIVPENVELCSTQGVFSRTHQSQTGNEGVVLITYKSGNTIQLNRGAGVKGLRIWHAKNDFRSALSNLKNNVGTDVSIKATADNCYAYYCESVGAYVGFDFLNSSNHYLKRNYGISYRYFIKAGGSQGKIVGCLANPNFMTRNNLYNFFDSSLSSPQVWLDMRNSGEQNQDFATLRDEIGRTYTKMVYLENAHGELAINTFCYGEAGLFEVKNSNDVLLVNTSLDYIPNSCYVYSLDGGSMTIISSLRVYGTSLGYKSGTLKAYGRIAFGELKEKAYDSTKNVEDVIEYVSPNATKTVLFNCESIPANFNGVSLNTNLSYVKQGSKSWKINSSSNQASFNGKFNSINFSAYKTGYVHMYIYCSDVSKLGDGQIEFSSSGSCDVNEMNWSFSQVIKNSGWNDVWLPISTAGVTGGAINLSSVNYMRIYILNTTATYYIDQIEIAVD